MAAYDKLIGPDGQPRFGRFSQPVATVNYRDFAYTDPLDREAGALARHFGLKQFHFLGLVSERYILGCAIVSLKYISNAFVYLFDRASGEIREKSLIQPLSLHCSMSNEPDSGMHRFRKGDTSFNIYSHPGRRQVEVFSGEDIHIDVVLNEPAGFQPIAVCTRTGFNGWTYTQKANALDASGRIRWGNVDIEVSSPTFFGSSDWSCGYMRRQTAWNWASLSGQLPDGRRLGANLANGVNETGFTENGFWIGNELHPLGPVHFQFDKKNRQSSWRIQDANGQLDLHFSPEGQRCEKRNALILASNFTQLAGRFNGSFTTAQGERIDLQDIPGFCEDHYAKW